MVERPVRSRWRGISRPRHSPCLVVTLRVRRWQGSWHLLQSLSRPRWLGRTARLKSITRLTLTLAVGLAGASGEEPTMVEPPPVEALGNSAEGDRPAEVGRWLAAVAPSQRVSWETRYELGAGDVVNVAFFGRATLDRAGDRKSVV